MVVPHERRVRLSIDVEPELRRRIKNAAAVRDLSVREYIEVIVRQALQADEMAERHLTPAEQKRGLRALTELEQLDQELLERRSGRRLSPSWELLDEARDERTRQLMQEE